METPPEGFDALLEAAPDAMLVVDAAGAVVFANAHSARLFRRDHAQLVGALIESLIPDRFRERHVGHRTGYVQEPRVRPMGRGLELFGLRGDGTEFPVEISLSPMVLAGRTYTIAAIRDVSERVRSTEAQRRLATIVETSVDGIVTKTLDGTITSWNPACERIFGYAASEVVGRDIQILYVPGSLDAERAILDRIKAGETVEVREVERVRKDGRRIWVSVSVTPMRDELGHIAGATTIKRDITDRKRAEAKFQMLLEAAPDAVVIVDAAGFIRIVNAQTERMFGYGRGDLVGKSVETLIPGRFAQRHVAHREGFFQAPRARPMGAGLELAGLRSDGTEFPLEISLSPLETDEGLLVTAAIRDVSDRKRRDAEARQQLVTKQFVRRILRELSQRGGASAATRRELGRSLASESDAKDAGEFLEAFLAMGVGRLALDRTEAGRYDFVGEGLLEMTPGVTTPTCNIALGYLEGLVSELEGTPALGAETACQSQGHPRCRFVVKAKPS